MQRMPAQVLRVEVCGFYGFWPRGSNRMAQHMAVLQSALCARSLKTSAFTVKFRESARSPDIPQEADGDVRGCGW